MSVWYTIFRQEDVEVSEDGKTIDVLFSTDGSGNNYVEIPIRFIETAIVAERVAQSHLMA